jgi:hypothetical protein
VSGPARIAAAYVGAQVLTGVEVGLGAAYLVLACGIPLPTALAAVAPIGLPLVAVQVVAIGALLGRGPAAED